MEDIFARIEAGDRRQARALAHALYCAVLAVDSGKLSGNTGLEKQLREETLEGQLVYIRQAAMALGDLPGFEPHSMNLAKIAEDYRGPTFAVSSLHIARMMCAVGKVEQQMVLPIRAKVPVKVFTLHYTQVPVYLLGDGTLAELGEHVLTLLEALPEQHPLRQQNRMEDFKAGLEAVKTGAVKPIPPFTQERLEKIDPYRLEWLRSPYRIRLLALPKTPA